tara:strand:- start:903 stop:1205 length:303 start_codon:yes stop_codon:yes gene_type:complete
MKNNLINFLDLKEWESEHSSVWREILSRWGEADYADDTKRAAHKETLKGEWEAYQYGRDRQKSYPEIGDQLDALYKAGVFPEDMEAEIKKVKDDNPKPTE